MPIQTIPLKGTLNTRDIGGYPAANGRTTLFGRVIRSANLAHITPADVSHLEALGIDTVVDLRGPKEAMDNPDQLPLGAKHINCPIIGSTSGDSIDDATIGHLITAAGLPPTMLNQEKVLSHGPYYRMLYLVSSYGTTAHLEKLKNYKLFFQELLKLPPSSNLLVHCTGGRDRTGVGIALLLKTLGVPDEVIEQDFVASNTYLQPDRENADSTMFLDFDSANVYLQPSSNKRYQEIAGELGTTPDMIRGAVELRRELLRKMFGKIEEMYGGFEEFLKEIGVEEREIQVLRAKFTA